MKRLVFVPPLTSVGAKIIDSRSWATLSIDRMSWRIDRGDIWILTGFCATISAVQKIQYLWKKMCGLDKLSMFSYLYHSSWNLTFSAPYNLRLYCYCCVMVYSFICEKCYFQEYHWTWLRTTELQWVPGNDGLWECETKFKPCELSFFDDCQLITAAVVSPQEMTPWAVNQTKVRSTKMRPPPESTSTYYS